MGTRATSVSLLARGPNAGSAVTSAHPHNLSSSPSLAPSSYASSSANASPEYLTLRTSPSSTRTALDSSAPNDSAVTSAHARSLSTSAAPSPATWRTPIARGGAATRERRDARAGATRGREGARRRVAIAAPSAASVGASRRSMARAAPRAAEGAAGAARATARRRRATATRGARARARASANEDEDEDEDFARWLARATKDDGVATRIALTERGRAFGTRGVEAVRDLAPGETLLRVPWGLVVESASASGDDDGDDDARWSSAMAMTLLEELSEGESNERAAWLTRLPRPAPKTPALDFDDEALREIEDESVVDEALAVRRAHERAREAYGERLAAIGATVEDLKWATAVVHSRVFTRRDGAAERATRLLVPGVDMCNHDAARFNAIVRVVTSPETCQGAAATEEIAEIAPSSTMDKFFELVVDPDGETVEAGEEILISYGSFPNDVWLMYFGFIPRGTNVNDTFVIFENVDELVAHVADEFRRDLDATTRARLRDVFGDDARVKIKVDSVDEKLIEACDDVLGIPWLDVVASRCRALLVGGRFRTKIKDDVAALADPNVSPETALAVEFRLRKKQILIAPLGQTLEKYGFSD